MKIAKFLVVLSLVAAQESSWNETNYIMKLSILNLSQCPENHFELIKDDNADVSVAENEAVTTTASLERGKVKYNR